MNKSITQATQNDNQISKSIKRFFTRFHVSSALKASNAYKMFLSLMILLLFSGSSVARAVFACSATVFRVANFSLVSPTASARSFCFCASSSVFPGSSFNNLSTSFSCCCVLLICPLTPFRAVCNLVVSPPISTVIPMILLATVDTSFRKNGHKKGPDFSKHEKSTNHF